MVTLQHLCSCYCFNMRVPKKQMTSAAKEAITKGHQTNHQQRYRSVGLTSLEKAIVCRPVTRVDGIDGGRQQQTRLSEPCIAVGLAKRTPTIINPLIRLWEPFRVTSAWAIYMYMYISIYTYTYVYIYTKRKQIYIYIYMNIRVHKYVYIYASCVKISQNK